MNLSMRSSKNVVINGIKNSLLGIKYGVWNLYALKIAE